MGGALEGASEKVALDKQSGFPGQARVTPAGYKISLVFKTLFCVRGLPFRAFLCSFMVSPWKTGEGLT
jgi:hypothetical protein